MKHVYSDVRIETMLNDRMNDFSAYAEQKRLAKLAAETTSPDASHRKLSHLLTLIAVVVRRLQPFRKDVAVVANLQMGRSPIPR